MTAQTPTYLKNTLFATGQASGAITALRMQDVADTIGARTFVSVMEYGAVGDGSAHAASTRYASLAALQAVYTTTVGGVAIALTNELDWLATQRAVDVVAAAGGGAIYSPPGTYVYTNASSAGDGSGQVKFPTTTSPANLNGVSWICNEVGTLHKWNNDLGSGKGAVVCGGRGATTSSGGIFRGLSLQGPGNGAVLNASACNMSGIMTMTRRNIYNCNIMGFRYGVDLVGGQMTHQNVYVNNCFYGYYYNTPDPVDFGNNLFIRVLVELCNKAAVAFQATAASAMDTFEVCFFGGSPYGIFLDGAVVPHNTLVGTKFNQCQFENIGNGLLGDDRANPAARVICLYQVWFNSCQFAWNGTYKIAAIANYAVIDAYILDQVVIDGIQSNAGAWSPGTQAVFSSQFTASVLIRGELTGGVFAGASAVPAFQGAWANNKVENMTSSQQWAGRIMYMATPAALNKVVVASTDQAAASAGNGTEVVLGAIAYTPPSGNFVVVVTSGEFVVSTTGSISAGWLYTGSTGTAQQSTTTNSRAAYAMTNSATNLWNTRIVASVT